MKWYERVFLTPEGRIHDEMIHIIHEILRRFFGFIGLSPAKADAEACVIEHEFSPVTTAAIGNQVRFLETAAGEDTRAALSLYLKLQNADIPHNEPVRCVPKISAEAVFESVRAEDRQERILSALTRHDLSTHLPHRTGIPTSFLKTIPERFRRSSPK